MAKLEKWPIFSFGIWVCQSRWSVQEMLAYLKKILNIFIQSMRLPNLHTLATIQPSWDLIRSLEISQDLLRSHKIYWDLKYQLIWHSAFNIWYMTLDIWHWYAFDIDMLWHLTIDIWHRNWMTWHSVMILAQTYLIFIDGFWGNISNLKTFSHSVSRWTILA